MLTEIKNLFTLSGLRLFGGDSWVGHRLRLSRLLVHAGHAPVVPQRGSLFFSLRWFGNSAGVHLPSPAETRGIRVATTGHGQAGDCQDSL